MRLFRGESLEDVSREVGVEINCFEAMEPVRQGFRKHFGGVDKGIALGLAVVANEVVQPCDRGLTTQG